VADLQQKGFTVTMLPPQEGLDRSFVERGGGRQRRGHAQERQEQKETACGRLFL